MGSIREMYFVGSMFGGSTEADMISGFPDPFAVATISGEQTRTTSVIKKTLNPYWNESFDMWELLSSVDGD